MTGAASPVTADSVACCHAERCAGCPQIVSGYDAQLAAKRGRVTGAVAGYPALESLAVAAVAPADPFTGYRIRAKFMVAPGPRVGLYAREGGHVVVDIPECRVLAPALVEAAEALRTLLRDPPPEAGAALVPYDADGAGALVAVDLREVEDQATGVLLTLVLAASRAPAHAALVAAGEAVRRACARVLGVAANFRASEAAQVLGPETVHLAGAEVARDRLGHAFHLATFGSFVQAHRGQARAIHALLAREIGGDRGLAGARVLDLYGGSGAIALTLAAGGADVTLVEAFPPAAESARRAAEAQGITGFRARPGDAATVTRALAASGERFDAIVVNPPRRGLAPETREAVARLGAPVVAYVSCDPETLARDLDHLARLGWTTGALQPFDMIPLTDEVETVAVLRRAPPPLPRVLWEDASAVVVDKGPHEPTTPQGEHEHSLLARVRRLPGCERAVPVHRLDVGTSGLVVFARSPDRVHPWAQALAAEGTRKVYLAAVRGVVLGKGTIARDLRDEGRMLSARTRYRRLAVVGGHSVLRVLPDEGRTHQIRRHLAGIGHAVLGDDRYGHAPTNRYFEERHGLDRTFLHCVRLELLHPHEGSRLVVESPLPGDLRATLLRMGGPGALAFLERKGSLGPCSQLADDGEATSTADGASDRPSPAGAGAARENDRTEGNRG